MVRRKRDKKMEKRTLVLDASVIIKWFTQEEKREQAIELREKYINGEIEIVVPDIILYEISNALRFNPNFQEKDIKEAIQSLFDIEIEIIVPIPEILQKSADVAYSKNITIYDAAYIALAQLIDFDFVTADEKLYEKIKDIKGVFLL